MSERLEVREMIYLRSLGNATTSMLETCDKCRKNITLKITGIYVGLFVKLIFWNFENIIRYSIVY